MNKLHYLILAAVLALAGCEQAQMFGPLGGAMVSVTEFRSGDTVVSGEFTDDEATAISIYAGEWGELLPLQKTVFIGNHRFLNSSVFVDDTWYLMRVEQGDDYWADANFFAEPTPVPNNGAVHAIVTGAQLKATGFFITPVTEAVYQYVKDFADDLNDEQLGELLDQVALELVGDTENDDDVDYADVLKWSRVLNLNPKHLLISTADLDALTTAVSAGDTDQANTLADALFSNPVPDGVPEIIYENSISDIITRPVGQGGCGQGCHYPGGTGSAASQNDLVPPTTENYVQLNTDNFRELVNNPGKGVSWILSKVQGGSGHGGGAPIASSTPEFSTFEDWLNLL
jgi:hypothetical protein